MIFIVGYVLDWFVGIVWNGIGREFEIVDGKFLVIGVEMYIDIVGLFGYCLLGVVIELDWNVIVLCEFEDVVDVVWMFMCDYDVWDIGRI